MPQPVCNPPAIIEVADLRHSYGDVQAVSGVTFAVSEGDIFCLVGPDGAGKTTIIRSIAGLIRPTSGSVTLWGAGWQKSRARLKLRIGYLSQRFSLYGDLTVSENIDFFARMFGCGGFEARRNELLELTGLAPFTGRLAERLSGGMKQKLALICSVIHSPELLLLDEPTVGVDPVSRWEFWRILSDIRAGGITIVLSTPYLDEAERCAPVAFVDRGEILAMGDPAEMRRRQGQDVVELTTEEPRRALPLIKAITGVRRADQVGKAIRIQYPPDMPLSDLVAAAAQMGVRIGAARRVSPSMDELFVRMLER